jgi:hypothetical protein
MWKLGLRPRNSQNRKHKWDFRCSVGPFLELERNDKMEEESREERAESGEGRAESREGTREGGDKRREGVVLAACLGEGVWLVWVAVEQSSSHSLHTGLRQSNIKVFEGRRCCHI